MLTVIEISFIHCFSGVVLSDSWQKHEHLHILPTTWNRNQECDKVFPCWNLSAASLSSKNLPAEMPLQTLRICEDFEHNYNTPVQTKKNMNLVLEIDYPIYRALHLTWFSPFMRWPKKKFSKRICYDFFNRRHKCRVLSHLLGWLTSDAGSSFCVCQCHISLRYCEKIVRILTSVPTDWLKCDAHAIWHLIHFSSVSLYDVRGYKQYGPESARDNEGLLTSADVMCPYLTLRICWT